MDGISPLELHRQPLSFVEPSRSTVGPASSSFENAARLTEIVLLGSVALRTGETIYWDGPGMKATNAPEAEPHIHGHFRKGWEV